MWKYKMAMKFIYLSHFGIAYNRNISTECLNWHLQDIWNEIHTSDQLVWSQMDWHDVPVRHAKEA
jgi:hypothetical protein